MRWHNQHDHCRVCRTTLFQHKAGGACRRCHSYERERTNVEAAQGEELKGFFLRHVGLLPGAIDFGWSDEQRRERTLIELRNRRIGNLVLFGQIENEPERLSTLLAMENILNMVARECRRGRTYFTGGLMDVQANMDLKNRQLMVLLLLRMLIAPKTLN